MEDQLIEPTEESADLDSDEEIEETDVEEVEEEDDEETVTLSKRSETDTADALRRFFKRDAEPKVTAYRPDLSNLKDAFEIDADGKVKFLGKPGDKIVVEYGGSPWRDTQLLVIDRINDANGDVSCWSVEKGYYSPINYSKEAMEKYLLKIKFADKAWIMGRRPRGRKKTDAKLGIDRSVQPIAVAVKKNVDPSTGKPKRGRPKGSKNKSTLEKLAKLEISGGMTLPLVPTLAKRPPGRPKGSLNRATIVRMVTEAAKKLTVA